MASLKDLKSSIQSVQSTKRITSAMKMVAAAKLKRATNTVEASRPYVQEMQAILSALASKSFSKNPLIIGTGKNEVHLLVIVSSDRGLCGGFNANLLRKISQHISDLEKNNKTIKIVTIGRKATLGLKSKLGKHYVKSYEDLNKPTPAYSHAEEVSKNIFQLLENQEFDVCSLFFNTFVSALEQKPTEKQLIPLTNSTSENHTNDNHKKESNAVYELEPSEDAILEALLPKNIIVQLYSAMLESFAGEQAARMTAMDNATTNAGDMIKKLSNTYNRTRQAQITKELIEIISGAEAL